MQRHELGDALLGARCAKHRGAIGGVVHGHLKRSAPATELGFCLGLRCTDEVNEYPLEDVVRSSALAQVMKQRGGNDFASRVRMRFEHRSRHANAVISLARIHLTKKVAFLRGEFLLRPGIIGGCERGVRPTQGSPSRIPHPGP